VPPFFFSRSTNALIVVDVGPSDPLFFPPQPRTASSMPIIPFSQILRMKSPPISMLTQQLAPFRERRFASNPFRRLAGSSAHGLSLDLLVSVASASRPPFRPYKIFPNPFSPQERGLLAVAAQVPCRDVLTREKFPFFFFLFAGRSACFF